jgi:hypothetical protein
MLKLPIHSHSSSFFPTWRDALNAIYKTIISKLTSHRLCNLTGSMVILTVIPRRWPAVGVKKSPSTTDSEFFRAFKHSFSRLDVHIVQIRLQV